jgi:hypothetical protein
MIETFNTFSITNTGRIGLLLCCIEKIKHVFIPHPETLNIIDAHLTDSWSWMAKRKPGCSDLYHTYNPVLIQQELAYHNDPSLLKAFHAVLYMHYYTLEKMYVTEYLADPSNDPVMGSDVFEVDETYFFNCLNNCIEVAGDPSLDPWITHTIERLQRDHSPADNNDTGNPVLRNYFLAV